MICKQCALGADLITMMREIEPIEISGANGYKARDFMGAARTLHNLCKGKRKGSTHCDCQHKIVKEIVTTPKGHSSPTTPEIGTVQSDGLFPPLY